MVAHSGLLTVMERAARKAAPRLRRDFNEVQHLQVSRKGPADFVSQADERAEATLIDATAATYKELRIWDLNGGAGKDRADASIKFFEESGLLKPGVVTFQKAFDIGPLEKVVKKIGRQ